jgi:hypothetical protein
MDEASTFFVRKFLPYFQDRVKNAGRPDPLERFALVGHSAGGMLANLILRTNDPILSTVTHVITVGTPFYGYAGHLHRWFEGVPQLNVFDLFKQRMMDTVASLPGPYVYNFLDEQTFNNTAHQTASTVDEFPLRAYPSMDAEVEDLRADPYNPQTKDDKVRYPMTTGFSRDELEYAGKQFQQLASPMDPKLLTKFHNIRGVRMKNGKPLDNTIGSIKWQWIAKNFDAKDETPIANVKTLVPGDDTQPAYTARLATNMDRCFTAKATDIEHLCLMNRDSVLMKIQEILCPEEADRKLPEPPFQPEPASDQEFVDFLKWMLTNWFHLRELKSFEGPDAKKAVPFNLPALGRRFLADMMRGTAPNGIDGRKPPMKKRR